MDGKILFILDIISQVAVSILGLTAMILLTKKNRWGWVFGLSSQPFWFITSYAHQQPGVFIITILYTYIWIKGCHEWFSKK